MGGYLMLVLASFAFVASHFAMSHTMRPAMVRIFGRGGFLGVYSLISLGLLIWMVMAFRAAPTEQSYWVVGDILWVISSILTLFAAVLYAGSMSGNPALPSPGAAELAARTPSGVFKVTRHPMMWSFAIWGISHILIAPRMDIFIFIGSIIFLALAGSAAQEHKKSKVMGVEWESWLRKTSYWPRLSQFFNIGLANWVIGFVIWMLATWAHNFFGPYGAGLFRWL
jgi:uncharacterized membrane protein